MEQNHENVIISIPNNNITTDPPQHGSRKRKNGPMHVLRVALFMMRSRSRKSSVLPVDDGSKSVWRKLVGSMRPLHLQSNQSPPSICKQDINDQLPPPSPSEYKTDCGSDALSDFPAEEEPYSPSPASSRYASAVGLNELVQSDEDNEKQEVIMEEECEERCDDGDEMIDYKADEFIAHFYEQMRLQRMNSVDRCYHERSQRSLGL